VREREAFATNHGFVDGDQAAGSRLDASAMQRTRAVRASRGFGYSWRLRAGASHNVDRSKAMKVSARNVVPATVKTVKPGAVDSEVVMELAPGIEMVSIITKVSAERLGLKPGAKVYAIVKASNVMIGVD